MGFEVEFPLQFLCSNSSGNYDKEIKNLAGNNSDKLAILILLLVQMLPIKTVVNQTLQSQ